MIKLKQKICKSCKDLCYLFSKGLCKSCWQKEYGKPIKQNKTQVKKVSDKGKEREKKYKDARDDHFINFPRCQRCGTEKDLECHHMSGRDGDNRYKNLMTVCRTCHQWIHEHVEESYKLGYLLSRLKNEKQEEGDDLSGSV